MNERDSQKTYDHNRDDDGRNTDARPKAKDNWDKASIIGQFVSGVVLVLVGLILTFVISRGQQTLTESIATAQLDATNRQIASDYLKQLMTANTTSDRQSLLEELDVALEPKYSVPLAVRFTRPVQLRTQICRAQQKDEAALFYDNALIGRTAEQLLQRLKVIGARELTSIKNAGQQPDSDIADEVLGGRPKVLLRVSEVDEFADVALNGEKYVTYQYGVDSGWVDVTSKVKINANNALSILVRNSPYEGTSVRFQIRAGAEQYDRMIVRSDWTGEGPAFSLGVSLIANDRGKFHINGDDVTVLGPAGVPHCED